MTAPKVFMFPCGCVLLGSKEGAVDVDCGDPRCYRRTRRTDVVQVGRAQRRALERRGK